MTLNESSSLFSFPQNKAIQEPIKTNSSIQCHYATLESKVIACTVVTSLASSQEVRGSNPDSDLNVCSVLDSAISRNTYPNLVNLCLQNNNRADFIVPYFTQFFVQYFTFLGPTFHYFVVQYFINSWLKVQSLSFIHSTKCKNKLLPSYGCRNPALKDS